MPKIFKSVLETIGHTPMIQLHHSVPKSAHTFLAKVEYFNPGGSVKDRIALSIVEEAEKSGALKPGGTLVEATSGNTGVGLAMVAALKGYKCIFVMPEKISEEKRATLRAYGARVVITPSGVAPEDPRSHYSVAKKFVEITPGAYLTNQYHNPANTKAHYEMTGPEIWDQTDGKIDVFVGGAGTGGTLSGVGRYLKEKNPNVKIVCADPFGSILYDLFYFKEVREKPAAYFVEGIGEDMLPDNVHFDVMDDFVRVSDSESFAVTRNVSRLEGLLVGPSCGAALAAAIQYSQMPGKLGRPSTIVTLFPDSGRSYLSKAFSDVWMRENGLLPAVLASTSVADLLAAGTTSAEEFSVQLQSSVKEAVQFARKKGLAQLFVFDGQKFVGTVDVAEMLAALAGTRLRADEPILHILKTGASEVAITDKLSDLETILKRETWARVRGENRIVTRADLAAFLTAMKV